MRGAAERARHLLHLGRPGEAEQALGTALVHAPEDAELLALLAHALEAQDRSQEALAAATAAITAAPEDLLARLSVVDPLLSLHQHDAAINAARWVVSLAPHAAWAHSVMARALLGDQHQILLAQQAIDHALLLDPFDADSHNLRGLILWERRWLPEAQIAFLTALELDPTHRCAQTNLAGVASDRGDSSAAGAGLRRLLAQDPAATSPRSMLGAVAAELQIRVLAILFGGTAVAGMLWALGARWFLVVALICGTWLGAGIAARRELAVLPSQPHRWLARHWWSADPLGRAPLPACVAALAAGVGVVVASATGAAGLAWAAFGVVLFGGGGVLAGWLRGHR